MGQHIDLLEHSMSKVPSNIVNWIDFLLKLNNLKHYDNTSGSPMKVLNTFILYDTVLGTENQLLAHAYQS